MGKTKKDTTEDHTGQSVALKKEVSILQGVSIVVGVIIGSGIFVSPVGVLRYTKSVGLSFVMWTVTGLFSALGAIVYAELGVTIPRSGGEYVYILQTFGPLPAFLAFWITFVVIGSASCAANSLIFADYILRPIYMDCTTPSFVVRIVALLGILTLCFIHCFSVKWATKTAIIFTTCKVAALLIIVGFGLFYLGKGNVESFHNSFEDSETSPGALALAFYQGFWAFSGWNYLNFLTGEVKNPGRTLPIVIILSLTTVTLIYIFTNVAYLAVLSPAEVLASGEGSTAIAVTFATRSMGVVGLIMPALVGASVFGSINGEIFSISRLAFTAGEEGHMPAILSMVNIDRLTPIPSILAVVILAILFQMSDNILYLIELTGFAFSVISAMAVCSLLYIRRTNPQMNTSGFKLPIFFPVLYLIVDIAIGILTIYQEPIKSAISLGVMLFGIVVYAFGVLWKKKPRPLLSLIYHITITLQKVLKVVEQDTVSATLESDDHLKLHGNSLEVSYD
ncbi:Cystine/glutamate transporter [Schistosoma japonicum]|uniref:Cystine/glutamate transporter n=2 Tax=Schistosoma japonicum TaxID=6182 RepID=C1L452_SCHJA|nr:Cystine/glutamate transporter [Schistosoma japonicum]TNN09541.1 Cystine/glutamate transporter [Schistosoma japonicum]CAX69480.1 Large neutral amino acids transporter small subunit 1 [Schistosoma japonicum]